MRCLRSHHRLHNKRSESARITKPSKIAEQDQLLGYFVGTAYPVHDAMTELHPGLIGTAEMHVTEQVTAARWGSGLVASLSTPAMIGLMETAAFNATRAVLPSTQTTVGVEVNIQHLAATPVGMQVRARAELERIDGRKLYFKVEAWDAVEKIGEGTHARFIVDAERFAKKFREKQETVSSV